MALLEIIIETGVDPITTEVEVCKSAQEEYEAVIAYLYPAGSSRKDLLNIPPYFDRRGLGACELLARLDVLDQNRLQEPLVEKWDGYDPMPRGTAERPDDLARELEVLSQLGRNVPLCPKRQTVAGSYGRRFVIY